MPTFVTVADLQVFNADIPVEQAQAMIDDATAMALLAAPCVGSDSFTNHAAVKAVLRAAILRWYDAGSGAVVQEQAGPFQHTIDTRQARRSLFWASEVDDLRRLCSAGGSGRAFTVDTMPADPEDV